MSPTGANRVVITPLLEVPCGSFGEWDPRPFAGPSGGVSGCGRECSWQIQEMRRPWLTARERYFQSACRESNTGTGGGRCVTDLHLARPSWRLQNRLEAPLHLKFKRARQKTWEDKDEGYSQLAVLI